MSEPICEVIITADDEDWLINFTRSLVQDRLAACVASMWCRSDPSIAGAGASTTIGRYEWRCTRSSLVPAIIDRTRRDHPYEVPCVLALPVVAGNPDYLAWVVQETTGV